MKGLVLGFAVLAGFSFGSGFIAREASAAPNPAHARCVAQAISPYVGPGFGQIVVSLVEQGEIFTTGTEASTNVCQ